MEYPILILAWGNAGRRDDGAALVLAERLERRFGENPDVVIQRLHQLGPELAEDLDRCRMAIFLDAHVRADEEDLIVERLYPRESAGLDTHHCRPEQLLALTRHLRLHVPEAVLVAVRAHDMTFGDELSEPTRRCLDDAEQRVARLVKAVSTPPHRLWHRASPLLASG